MCCIMLFCSFLIALHDCVIVHNCICICLQSRNKMCWGKKNLKQSQVEHDDIDLVVIIHILFFTECI